MINPKKAPAKVAATAKTKVVAKKAKAAPAAKALSAATQAAQKIDSAHHLHPFSDFKAMSQKGVRVVTRGKGCRIWDSEGNEIIDAMSGLWCVNLGYGRDDLVKAATDQLNELPFYNSFFGTTHPAVVELSALICQVAPKGFNHVMYTNSGSEGNDTMVRMVRRYWDVLGQPKRKTFIGRINGYHGSTLAGASLGGMTWMHEQGDLPLPGFTHIEQPYYLMLGKKGESEDDFGIRAAGWLEEKILKLGADKVAGFIAEPIQGSGGVIVPPKTYWPEISRILKKYGVLLCQDEVITGFGRLGTMFGCQHPLVNTKPDIITFAKGVTSGYLPLGGVLVGEKLAKVLIDQGGEFHHGFTYSGHPASCAVAVANIRAIVKEKIVERVNKELAPYFAQHFHALAKHPLVGQTQVIGMMAALTLAKKKTPHTIFDNYGEVGLICREFCFANGVVMRAVGHRMIIAPPLTMSLADLDEMFRRIRKSLDETAAKVLP